ncbi:hypothetical protein [Luteolibacter sp. AS25]|uniref:hypothetical protein n=1 Tax=Luteolibacter sp. AS25 TaxID=3135776 RepID=UPI00398AC1D5
MNTDIIETEQDPKIVQGAKTLADNVKSKACNRLEDCEEKIRQSPGKAVLIALGAGYCLNRLPVAALLAAPIRLTAIFAKPALLVLGAAKLYDIVEQQSRK